MTLPPTDYRAGFAALAAGDRPMGEAYLRHVTLGDPEADAALHACRDATGAERADWFRRGIEGGPDAIADAPADLRDLLAASARVPDWFDPAATGPGCRALHGHSEMFLGAFVGAVLIEGFSTLISRSFAITGRLVDAGTRRLKQNNRHLSEIFLPGGMERDGDGWKLSVRIRLMHARVRQMLAESDEWDAAAWGTPLSAGHLGFATAAFSGLLLRRVAMLGVALPAEERASFMMTWRYSGHLMGVPDALQCATEAQALELVRVGRLVEPPPDLESVLLANALINSAPVVAGIVEAGPRRRLVRRIYRVSRALIGDGLADALRYPPSRSFGILGALRWRNRLDRALRGAWPGWDRRRRAGQFQRMLDLSFHGGEAHDYRPAAHLHAEKDRGA